MEQKRALFIGAHHDDNEYGAGGMACLLKQKGFDIYFIDVAMGIRQPHMENPAYSELYKTNQEEEYKAAKVLGAEKIVLETAAGKHFFECTDDNIGILRTHIQEINPDIAFIHWPCDNHHEHVEVSKASFRALCYSAKCEIHAYEAGPFQSMVYFYPDYYVNISGYMDRIKESLLVLGPKNGDGKWLAKEKEVSAAFRGHMSEFGYAEAFKIIKFPIASRSQELMLPKLLQKDFRWAGSSQYPWGSHYFNNMIR